MDGMEDEGRWDGEGALGALAQVRGGKGQIAAALGDGGLAVQRLMVLKKKTKFRRFF